jgi:hypothetical protein
MKPVMQVQSCRKLLSDLKEDELEGFPNKVISKSEIFDMVFAMKSFENFYKEMMKNGCRVMSVKWNSST